MDELKDRMLSERNSGALRLRRVGRLARRRMRIEGSALANGVHTDGRLSVTISGLGKPAAGAPDTFEWAADRPIALVIVRAGLDGDDLTFQVGPLSSGRGPGTAIGDGTGIRYIAFCYDAEPEPVAAVEPVAASVPVPTRLPDERPAAVPLGEPSLLARMLRSGATS
jgi:hypothetical protein